MKTLLQHITERLQLNKDRVQCNVEYKYFPETLDELRSAIIEISESIEHTSKDIIDLNCINTSKITNMRDLFYDDDDCNYDISQWDVSNVRDMGYMFYGSIFNNDISQWDVSNVLNMEYMFAYSEFNQNINKWNVSHIRTMKNMFKGSPLEKYPPKWYKNK